MRPTKACTPLPITYATEQFHVTTKYSTVDILLHILGNRKAAKNNVIPFPTRTCGRDLMGKHQIPSGRTARSKEASHPPPSPNYYYTHL